MARIGFTGTQSVGKTTLVNALKQTEEFKGYNFRTERSKYLMDQGIPLNNDSTLKGQCVFLAERSMELMCDNIITDRTIIDVMAFADSSTSMNSTEKSHFMMLSHNLISEYDYIFYISPKGIDVEDNGVRTTDVEYRHKIDLSIKSIIDCYSSKIKNYNTLTGSTEERIQQIKEIVFS